MHLSVDSDREARELVVKLSMSVRVREGYRDKRVFDGSFPDFLAAVRDAGFDAVCMRASVVGIHSPEEEVAAVHDLLAHAGVGVSMVTGDFAVPANGPDGPRCLRAITPYLDLASALGSDLVRISMKEAADIRSARMAADEAAERGIRLAHQSHHTSLFETVAGSLATLQAVNRANFGIIYEPANLAMCGEDYGHRTIEVLGPYLFNVYLQNQVPDPSGEFEMTTWARGRVKTRIRPLDEPGGIDFAEIFDALRAIGYDGYVTSHQAIGTSDPLDEVAARYASFLRSWA